MDITELKKLDNIILSNKFQEKIKQYELMVENQKKIIEKIKKLEIILQEELNKL